jgi:hypothetical protein
VSGFGRITQEIIEVLGPDQGFGRITQEIAEALGPVPSTARVTQLYVEALCATDPRKARITQETVEVLGPPDINARISQLVMEALGPPNAPARITQLVLEVLGPQAIVPCRLPWPLSFFGNVSGQFYKMVEMGAETVPIAMQDSIVTINNGMALDISLTLTQEEQWAQWDPQAGALKVDFANGNPVRFLWVVTNGARFDPPVIPVWASSRYGPLWKQLCIS